MNNLNVKLYTIFIIIVCLFSFHTAFASVAINEVMYNLDGSDIDYIEVYNPDSTSVDLSNLNLFISNNTSNHSIKNYSGSSVLAEGDYGIIVPTTEVDAFISKWGSPSSIFNASFTLPNISDGETTSININNNDKTLPLDEMTYSIDQGANSNGSSLQLVNNTWQEASPTPGQANIEASGGSSSGGSTSSSSSSGSATFYSINTNKVNIVRKISAQINIPRIVYAGIPTKINPLVTTNKNEILKYGDYKWSFGDGTNSEYNNSNSFSHTFYYPGEYVVILNYFEYRKLEADATSMIIVKVLPAEVLISSIGTKDDPFVELENKSNYEIDISGWSIQAGEKYFIIPIDTILLPKKKIKLSPNITHFSYSNLKYIFVLNKNGKIVANFPVKIAPKIKKVNTSYNTSKNSKTTYVNKKIKEKPKDIINLNDLGASVGNTSTRYSMKTLSIVGLFILIFISFISILLLKKKDSTYDNFEKEIKPEDMTIIE